MSNQAPQRPLQYTEEALITAILDGTYTAHSTLPGERDLAAQLGVTRPTLREALRRLESDGWLTIQQGKSTLVNDFWREGGLNVLSAIVRYSQHLPPNFVVNLLQVRLDMAPTYTAAAVEHAPLEVIALLRDYETLADTPDVYAAFDWRVQHGLTLASGNPVYTLIMNGFAGFYEQLACLYFAYPEARAASRAYYQTLLQAAEQGDVETARTITRDMMERSIMLWRIQEGKTCDDGMGRAMTR